MALKDLVAQKAKLTEDAIESIISDYVRYDTDERETVFTPNATMLSSRAKILIFLVAQQGWQFVLDEAIDVEVAPSRMEELLGIQGGSLRPVLKDLKDRNLLTARSGKYTIRPSALDAIRLELGRKDSVSNPSKKRTSHKKRSNKKNPNDSHAETTTDLNGESELKQTPTRSAKGSTQPGHRPGAVFDEVLTDGFFDVGRTLGQLEERFHERGIIVKQTSLPKYLLKAVRDSRLKRKKEEVNGKHVWVYTTAN